MLNTGLAGALGAVSPGMETPQHLGATSANIWLSSLWKFFSLHMVGISLDATCDLPILSAHLWQKDWLHLLYNLQLGRCRDQEDPSQFSLLQAEEVQPPPPLLRLHVLQPVTILVTPYILSKSFCTEEPQTGHSAPYITSQLTLISRARFPATLRVKHKSDWWMLTLSVFQTLWCSAAEVLRELKTQHQ